MRHVLAGLLVCLSCVTAQAASETASTPPAGELLDRIVAIVNDDVVTLTELDTEVETIKRQLEEQGRTLPTERLLRRQVLERLILQKLQLQIAERAGIRVSDDQLNQALTRIAQRNGTTLSELPRLVEAQGIAYPIYREQIRRDMIMNEVRRREIERRVLITEREIENQLAAQREDDATEYDVSHIYVALSSQADEELVERNRQRAQAIYERVTSPGVSFADIAVAYSDAEDALQGGALGWRKLRELPTIFAERVRAMKPGEVSEPFRSQSGFHIIRLNDVRRGENRVVVTQNHARHILLRTNELVSDEQARAKLAELRARLLAGEDFASLARQHSEDPGSALEGGDLGWMQAGSFVPEFEERLAALKPGEISEPFRTTFGWHIVQLLERREQDVTEEARRNRAAAEIRARKVEEQTQLWLQNLRESAYLEIRLES
ncbi:MAG TPA: peptidylprolyl isomerase SurA [Gammaproteobacteria bacterium]|nr:peptidylprolyl isomerase SurA [Gammaproteobacteria bacterium]